MSDLVSRSRQFMAERRVKRKRWVQRGDYAVEVEVEVVYPSDDPSDA
jgi:hypothetical protein